VIRGSLRAESTSALLRALRSVELNMPRVFGWQEKAGDSQ